MSFIPRQQASTNTPQKKKKPKAEGEDAEDVLSGLKKKKKSKKPKAETDDFDAQLAAVAGDDAAADSKEAPAEEEVEEGDMMKGTGVWAHDSTVVVPYNMLLNRFFTLLHSQHPDLASSGSKSYKIPPPQCLREGNKKTIFANISEICKRMKRTDEHGAFPHPLFYQRNVKVLISCSDAVPLRRTRNLGLGRRLQAPRHQGSFPAEADRERAAPLHCRIRHLQDVPLARLGAHKGREQAVVRHLQLVRVAEIGQRDQDGFLGAGRQAEEDAEVDGTGRVYWATMERACGFVWRHVLGGLRDECMYVQRI
jgi:hypothetical protein